MYISLFSSFLFIYNRLGCCKYKGSLHFLLDHNICCRHASSKQLHDVKLMEWFIPRNFSSCPALVQKPAVPLKTIHNQEENNIQVSRSSFCPNLTVIMTLCRVHEGIGRQVMTRFSKGIDCTGGSVVEAQAEGALTASCCIACSSWAVLVVLAKKKTKREEEKKKHSGIGNFNRLKVDNLILDQNCLLGAGTCSYTDPSWTKTGCKNI